MSEAYKVRELAAGPLLDRLVAEQVLRWDVHFKDPELPGEWIRDPEGPTLYRTQEWCPSSDPEQALLALRRVQAKDWSVEAEIHVQRADPEGDPYWGVIVRRHDRSATGTAMEYSFPHALSKALLDYSLNCGEK